MRDKYTQYMFGLVLIILVAAIGIYIATIVK